MRKKNIRGRGKGGKFEEWERDQGKKWERIMRGGRENRETKGEKLKTWEKKALEEKGRQTLGKGEKLEGRRM